MKKRNKKVNKGEVFRVRNKPALALVISMYFLVLLIAVDVNSGIVSAALPSFLGRGVPSYQSYNPTFQQFYSQSGVNYQDFWPILGNPNQCSATQDFILFINPLSCTPQVVRSDLLEEQNVPIFCPVSAIKLNPLIDVAEIKSIQFSGNTGGMIAGISFHPARAAVKIYDKTIGSPIESNIGYVVIILKRTPAEKDMPDSVKVNLTAKIFYDMQNAFGTGKAEIYAPVLSDEDWNNNYVDYEFWRGKGYVRVNDVSGDKAEISIYSDQNNVVRNFVLQKGQTSDLLYLPGFYCKAGVRFKLNDVSSPERKVKVQVDENELVLVKGQKFLDNKCSVSKIDSLPEGGNVVIKCPGKTLNLRLGVSDYVQLENKGASATYKVGQEAGEGSGVYIAYSGIAPKGIFGDNPNIDDADRRFVVLVNGNLGDKIINSDGEIKEINKDVLDRIKDGATKSVGLYNFLGEKFDINSKKKYSYVVTSNVVKAIIKAKLNTGAGIFSTITAIWDNIWIAKTLEDQISIVYFGEEDKIYNKGSGFDIAVNPGFKYKFIGTGEPADLDYKDKTDGKKFEAYFEKTIGTANDLTSLYGNEREIENDINSETFAAKILDEAATLSLQMGKDKTAKELLEKLVNEYPDSSYTAIAKAKLDRLSKFDFEDSGAFVDINYEPHFIRVVDIKEVGLNEASVEFLVGGNKYRIMKDERVNTKEDLTTDYFDLVSFDEDSVKIKYSYTEKNEKGNSNLYANEFEIGLGESKIFRTTTIKVNQIFLKKEARISIVPEVQDKFSNATFSHEIGIEKRAIQLSPEKTKELIAKLNKTIEKWQSITDSLGSVVSGLKAVCFATSTILLVKNFFENAGGKGMARQIVMRSPGGWIEKCLAEITITKESMNACLSKHASEINSAVDEVNSNIQRTNNELAPIQEKFSKTDGLFGKIVDNKKAGQDYLTSYFVPYVKTDSELLESLGGETGIRKLYDSGELSLQDMRDIVTYGRMSSGANSDFANKKLEVYTKPLIATAAGYKNSDNLKTLNLDSYKPFGTIDASKALSADVFSYENKDKGIEKGDFVLMNPIGENMALGTKTATGIPTYEKLEQKQILIQVTEAGTGTNIYTAGGPPESNTANDTYFVDGTSLVKLTDTEFKNLQDYLRAQKIDSFKRYTSDICKNPYKNVKVKYFEREPYKGLPAIVPVDVKNGWYAGTKQVLPGFGIQAYDESGRVSSLWLCNVGPNGLEEFESSSSDDYPCIQINLNTGQPLDQISCLSSAQAKDLVNRAVSLVRQAADQYGKKSVSLSGIGAVAVGQAAGYGQGTQCQDFMSPEDCKILFNVCDPVICPTSRCNLGGAYPVDNVIQSGIIGSIALCLPNINEGIVVPVCLTGIKAGLDSLISILKAGRDCMQNSLDTGQMVGVCDEMTSIYLCEFFWRQLAPLLDVAIPKIIEYAYTGGTQGARGGGEYLTVMNAWDNAQKSVGYFTSYYALNSMNAFRARSTAEAGTDVCKLFVSTKYPNQGNFFENLIAPDSPVQFSAWFDETTFTTATVPATSQYKVYYHIYAGQDAGSYYSVYLKNPPQTSYYSSQPIITVDTGFIGRGSYIDQTKDFTAPSGYKELCVRIDTKEECGFQKVSTLFAINYIADEYAKEQATEQITNEKDCISGTSSLYALVNPNLQAGAEEAANPAIYNRGIIRVCSSANPGQSTNIDRWRPMGDCDKDRGIVCWVDLDSVKNAIKGVGLEKSALGEVENLSRQLENVLYLDETATNALLGILAAQKEEIINKINNKEFDSQIFNLDSAEFKNTDYGKLIASYDGEGKLIGGLDYILQVGIPNSNKAKAMYYEYKIYAALTKRIYEISIKKPENVVTNLQSIPSAQTTPSSSSGAGGESETGTAEKITEITGTELNNYRLENLHEGDKVTIKDKEHTIGDIRTVDNINYFVYDTDNKVIFKGYRSDLLTKFEVTKYIDVTKTKTAASGGVASGTEDWKTVNGQFISTTVNYPVFDLEENLDKDLIIETRAQNYLISEYQIKIYDENNKLVFSRVFEAGKFVKGNVYAADKIYDGEKMGFVVQGFDAGKYRYEVNVGLSEITSWGNAPFLTPEIIKTDKSEGSFEIIKASYDKTETGAVKIDTNKIFYLQWSEKTGHKFDLYIKDIYLNLYIISKDGKDHVYLDVGLLRKDKDLGYLSGEKIQYADVDEVLLGNKINFYPHIFTDYYDEQNNKKSSAPSELPMKSVLESLADTDLKTVRFIRPY